eukprot:6061-Heterococcus_DN1.PRE.7
MAGLRVQLQNLDRATSIQGIAHFLADLEGKERSNPGMYTLATKFEQQIHEAAASEADYRTRINKKLKKVQTARQKEQQLAQQQQQAVAQPQQLQHQQMQALQPAQQQQMQLQAQILQQQQQQQALAAANAMGRQQPLPQLQVVSQYTPPLQQPQRPGSTSSVTSTSSQQARVGESLGSLSSYTAAQQLQVASNQQQQQLRAQALQQQQQQSAAVLRQQQQLAAEAQQRQQQQLLLQQQQQQYQQQQNQAYQLQAQQQQQQQQLIMQQQLLQQQQQLDASARVGKVQQLQQLHEQTVRTFMRDGQWMLGRLQTQLASAAKPAPGMVQTKQSLEQSLADGNKSLTYILRVTGPEKHVPTAASLVSLEATLAKVLKNAKNVADMM